MACAGCPWVCTRAERDLLRHSVYGAVQAHRMHSMSIEMPIAQHSVAAEGARARTAGGKVFHWGISHLKSPQHWLALKNTVTLAPVLQRAVACF